MPSLRLSALPSALFPLDLSFPSIRVFDPLARLNSFIRKDVSRERRVSRLSWNVTLTLRFSSFLIKPTGFIVSFVIRFMSFKKNQIALLATRHRFAV